MPQIKRHYPSPESLWGDCTIKSWDRKSRGWFSTWLNALASMTPFATQQTINKINNLVLSTIKQANEGTLTPIEAISKVRPLDALTTEEIFYIKKQVSLYGDKIGTFYLEDEHSIN